MATKKRYAIVGTGGRSGIFSTAILKDYRNKTTLAGLCDINPLRMKYVEKSLRERFGSKPIPQYLSTDFDKMVKKEKPHCVIVTSMDRTHHKYICRAMELGCDVITEKPMTTDAEKCQAIVDTVKRTKRKLTVTFNYRYSPRNTKIKEVIQSGEIGDVTSVHFEWVLSTRHGADYFRRWHRDKTNSGGLLVHKSTHHFDLVNWWIHSSPQTVFALGRLAFYGRENAENRGVTQFYSRSTGSKVAEKDPFALPLDRQKGLRSLYLEPEASDGYQRDQSVFGMGISIEDNMAVLVQYRNKALLTYSLNAHAPWEGYRVMFNGTKGRLEANINEVPYISGAKDDANQPENRGKEKAIESKVPEILLQHHWKKPVEVSYESAKGGHGGGDVRLLDDIFLGVKKDPLGRAAGIRDGAMSILTGVAANTSIASGLPVQVDRLVRF